MIGDLRECDIHGHWKVTPGNDGANSRCPDCLIEEQKAHVLTRETINHPQHYGGDTTYEAIKVIEAWGLGFCLGNPCALHQTSFCPTCPRRTGVVHRVFSAPDNDEAQAQLNAHADLGYSLGHTVIGPNGKLTFVMWRVS